MVRSLLYPGHISSVLLNGYWQMTTGHHSDYKSLNLSDKSWVSAPPSCPAQLQLLGTSTICLLLCSSSFLKQQLSKTLKQSRGVPWYWSSAACIHTFIWHMFFPILILKFCPFCPYLFNLINICICMLEENEIASPLLKVRPHGTNGTHRTPWDIAVNFAKLAILCSSGLRTPGRQQFSW